MAKKEFNEFDLLELFYREMEEKGIKSHLVLISIDDRLVESLYDKDGVSITLAKLRTLTNKCLANEWLKRNFLSEHYYKLNLTDKGLGIVLSKRAIKDKNKTLFQKTSNFAKTHKALIGLLGVVFTVISLFFKFGDW